MSEIVRVAKEERIIVLCTIHQPSTKVYNGFDELMLLSRGRLAFTGDVNDAVPYFHSIGFPCPQATNPAEFFLDLVNSDFSDEAAVTSILDTWEEKRPDAGSSHHKKKGFEAEGQEGVTELKRASLTEEMSVMLRRHFTLVIRDPILYLGRCVIFLVSCLIFAFVYWNSRDFTAEQVLNKMWVTVWFVAVPSNLGKFLFIQSPLFHPSKRRAAIVRVGVDFPESSFYPASKKCHFLTLFFLARHF